MIYALTRRAALIGGACAAMTLLSVAPSQAAAKIQRLVSPGGIEAWFVQDATVPLIAMEYAFAGGASQDPTAKPGVGNMVADLLDEGSGDLDSKTFHERLERRVHEGLDRRYSAKAGSKVNQCGALRQETRLDGLVE